MSRETLNKLSAGIHDGQVQKVQLKKLFLFRVFQVQKTVKINAVQSKSTFSSCGRH